MLLDDVISLLHRWQTSHTTTRVLTRLPESLVVVLVRFGNGRWNLKNETAVQINDDLDLRSLLCDRPSNEDASNCCYHLWGVVEHHGKSIRLGHYTATVRDPDGCVVHYNDAVVRDSFEFVLLHLFILPMCSCFQVMHPLFVNLLLISLSLYVLSLPNPTGHAPASPHRGNPVNATDCLYLVLLEG
jgi:hypothetical protein